ncbi:hypothetical protein WA158_003588 [Blastocystis sp. Blastoise]
MRLITHNFLMCTVKNCVATNFPLIIETTPEGLVIREEEMNPEFIKHIMNKLDWDALYQGASSIGIQIPQEKPTDLDNEEILKGIHHAINEVDIISGKLICAHCHREYPIEEGIPNMLLNEDEV